MSATAESFLVYKHVKIASDAVTVPTLVLWIGLLVRILIQKNKEKIFGMIVVCILNHPHRSVLNLMLHLN